jgi:uncharacterized membrane protein YsdA (DUF1294 family)
MGYEAHPPPHPVRRHTLIALVLSLLVAVGVLLLLRASWSGWHLLLAWLLGVNVTAFGYYGYDKGQAQRGGRRVPELVLHGLALAGGSPAAYAAMRLFRHKTIKGSFRVVFWCIVAVQVVLIAWSAYQIVAAA